MYFLPRVSTARSQLKCCGRPAREGARGVDRGRGRRSSGGRRAVAAASAASARPGARGDEEGERPSGGGLGGGGGGVGVGVVAGARGVAAASAASAKSSRASAPERLAAAIWCPAAGNLRCPLRIVVGLLRWPSRPAKQIVDVLELTAAIQRRPDTLSTPRSATTSAPNARSERTARFHVIFAALDHTLHRLNQPTQCVVLWRSVRVRVSENALGFRLVVG